MQLLKVCLSLLAFSTISYSSEKKEAPQKFQTILLPGQNGAGGKLYQSNSIINNAYKRYSTIRTNIDLGQTHCMKDFENHLKYEPFTQDMKLMYGVSQGTATLTNWVAQKTHAEQEATVGGLVLESVLGHGDSAIMHSASNIPLITYLPFSRAWIPSAVRKFMFPHYRSRGPQAMYSAAKLSPKLPVIIMHNKQDLQLSVNDAREVYCRLKENGNNNAYLMEIDGKDKNHHHLDVIEADQDSKTRNIAALQTMYKKHGLPYDASRLKDGEVDLKEFQPSAQEVRARINSSTRPSWWLRNIIDCGTLAAVGWLLGKYISK